MKHLYLVLITLLLAGAMLAEEAKPAILFPDHHLCLEASGKLVVPADQAVFSFETKGFGPTLREAVGKAKDNVAAICGELSALGIDPKSFATASFTSGKNGSASFLTDKKDYAASLYTTVTLRDLTYLDEAILILTDKKTQNLSGVQFSLSDYSTARQRAREIALNRIVEQRETMSRILGVTITDVQLIDEAPFENLPWGSAVSYSYKSNYPGPINAVTNFENSMEAADSSSPRGGFFSPEITVETQVRVIYRIGMTKL